MNYLKLYEFFENKLYTQIDYQELKFFEENKKGMKFSKGQRDRILNTINNEKENDYDPAPYSIYSLNDKNAITIVRKDYRIRSDVYYFEDEYYLISYYFGKDIRWYFKCDQFDGLLEFVRNLCRNKVRKGSE